MTQANRKTTAAKPTEALNKALVLSGGGARGAYQVGVLSAVADIAQSLGIKQAFDIYTGCSAGAINAAFLASGAEDYHSTCKSLVDMWSQLGSDQIFYSDIRSFGKLGLNWMKSVSAGGVAGLQGQALLDTSPLRALLNERLPFDKIQQNIDSGALKALAITALDYETSTAITFVQGADNVPAWKKSRRKSEVSMIKTEHVLASAAIPLLFPPVAVGDRHFGDGCIRNTTPCSPSIYLGAKKLMVIGVRRQGETAYETRTAKAQKPPSVGRVLN
ncbi:MAG: hypothetical protein EOP06_29740, partial [Proteobacteria bacterium]